MYCFRFETTKKKLNNVSFSDFRTVTQSIMLNWTPGYISTLILILKGFRYQTTTNCQPNPLDSRNIGKSLKI